MPQLSDCPSAQLPKHWAVFDLTRLRYVLYEAKGDLTVVPDPDAPDPEAPLVQAGLDSADGYQHRSNPGP